MRLDDNHEYCLWPIMASSSSLLLLEEHDDENADEKKEAGATASSLTIDLHQLPLLTEHGEQTPIGARGWYASAVLSALFLSGNPLLTDDVMGGSHSRHHHHNPTKRTTTMIELGSGSLGLSGMALAWMVSQINHHRHHHQQQHQQQKTKVVLTDYDPDCLEQLKTNASKVQLQLQEYYHHHGGGWGDDDGDTNIVPEIIVHKLDWNESHQRQPLLDGDHQDDCGDDDVTFVCGAALVYCEDTVGCTDQVEKILRLHPRAAVWVVQVSISLSVRVHGRVFC